MKKIVVLAVGVLAMALAIAPAVVAQDAQGPGCADIISGQGNYNNGTLSVLADTAAGQPCANGPVTYTIDVYDDAAAFAAGDLPIRSTSTYQNVNGSIGFLVPGADTDDKVCVVVTTMIGPVHVVDRAPDSGCVEIDDDSPQFGGFS